jgi:hypothetical protein
MVNPSLLQQAEIGLCNDPPQWKPFVKVNGHPQAGNLAQERPYQVTGGYSVSMIMRASWRESSMP